MGTARDETARMKKREGRRLCRPSIFSRDVPRLFKIFFLNDRRQQNIAAGYGVLTAVAHAACRDIGGGQDGRTLGRKAGVLRQTAKTGKIPGDRVHPMFDAFARETGNPVDRRVNEA